MKKCLLKYLLYSYSSFVVMIFIDDNFFEIKLFLYFV